VPESEGGRFAEVCADATTVWSLLVKGALEELGKDGHARPLPPDGVAHERLQEPRGPTAPPATATPTSSRTIR